EFGRHHWHPLQEASLSPLRQSDPKNTGRDRQCFIVRPHPPSDEKKEHSMTFLNRRDFLRDSTALAAALAGLGTWEHDLHADDEKINTKKNSGDTLRVAVIGVHGRGKSHVSDLAGKHNCVVTTVCDADEAVIGPAMRHVEIAQGELPKYVKDLRQ